MSVGRMASLCCIVIVVLAFTVCTKPQPKNPEEVLKAYATSRGGEWIEEVGVLNGGSADVLEELGSLPTDSLQQIRGITVTGAEVRKIPDLHRLIALKRLILSSNQLQEISGLAGLHITYLDLGNNHSLKDIGALSSCAELEYVTLVGTGINRLPDLSALHKLRGLGLTDTALLSLVNIDSIPSDFDLNIMGCQSLQDIGALRSARVNTLFLDRSLYEQFKPWFDEHLDQIKATRPEFNLRFAMTE